MGEGEGGDCPPKNVPLDAVTTATSPSSEPLPSAKIGKPEYPNSKSRPKFEVKDTTPKKQTQKQCNCKHSKCLKLYCECFTSGIYCDGCKCVNCCNNVDNEVARREAVEATLERNPNAFRPKIASSPHGTCDIKEEAGEVLILGKHNKGCHCKKSGCLKKYCECFQANILCSEKCRCTDCKNFEGSEERQALINGDQNDNMVYIQQAANAPIIRTISSSSYSSLPVLRKRKGPELFFGPTVKDPSVGKLRQQKPEVTSAFDNWRPSMKDKLFPGAHGECMLRMIDEESEDSPPIAATPLSVKQPRKMQTRSTSSATSKMQPSAGVMYVDALQDPPTPISKMKTRGSGITISKPFAANAPASKPSSTDNRKSTKNSTHVATPTIVPKKPIGSTSTTKISDTTVESPALVHASPVKAPKPHMPNEVLTQYFSSQPDLSPIAAHLDRIEAALDKEIPTDQQVVTSLRLSLFKLAKSTEATSTNKDLFTKMALQVSDISHDFKSAHECYQGAAFDLGRLRQLQEQKSNYQLTYQSVENERQADLAEQGRLNDRMKELTTELDRIQKEMNELQPKINMLNTKLNASADQRINLYTQSTSLDSEIIFLLQQKEALEKDFRRGEVGLIEARKSWNNLRDLLAEAKKGEACPSGDPIISQPDGSIAPVMPSATAPIEEPYVDVRVTSTEDPMAENHVAADENSEEASESTDVA